MKEPKHRTPSLPGPRHLARARLSMIVRLLEFSDADLGEDTDQHEWWSAREARALEMGARP
jgi:hypothetical protein